MAKIICLNFAEDVIIGSISFCLNYFCMQFSLRFLHHATEIVLIRVPKQEPVFQGSPPGPLHPIHATGPSCKFYWIHPMHGNREIQLKLGHKPKPEQRLVNPFRISPYLNLLLSVMETGGSCIGCNVNFFCVGQPPEAESTDR